MKIPSEIYPATIIVGHPDHTDTNTHYVFRLSTKLICKPKPLEDDVYLSQILERLAKDLRYLARDSAYRSTAARSLRYKTPAGLVLV